MSLTVLSFGGGQDSTAILYAIRHNLEWRNKFAPEDFVVVMSDTGDEHPSTVQHVSEVWQWCHCHGIEFVHLTPDKGFHGSTWKSLRGQFELNSSVGMKRGAKSCTDQLKIRPIYRWLESYVSSRYGIESKNNGKGKSAIIEYAKQNGKIKMLIGIAKGEEKRMATPSDADPIWRSSSIEIQYPLIHFGLDRKGCQDLIASYGYKVPTPSNCVLCPFMSKVELLWLSRRMPEDLQQWIRYEDRKIQKYESQGVDPKKNLTVWGTKRLAQVVAEAETEFGHMTDDQLDEYKMSHGHCVSSKY